MESPASRRKRWSELARRPPPPPPPKKPAWLNKEGAVEGNVWPEFVEDKNYPDVNPDRIYGSLFIPIELERLEEAFDEWPEEGISELVFEEVEELFKDPDWEGFDARGHISDEVKKIKDGDQVYIVFELWVQQDLDVY